MLRAFFFCLLISLASCNNHKKGNAVITKNNSPVVVQQKADTLYHPLYLKISKNDSLTIKRLYYNPQNLNLYHEVILRNGKQIYKDTTHQFLYESKYNRIIKSHDNVLLFLENDGAPNFNFISAYTIHQNKVTFISDCIYNDNKQGGGSPPFTDMDQDGYLEYGGFDTNEVPEHPDSMYYNPSEFYEIRNGIVSFDSTLAKKSDIRHNGIYLSNFMDKNGNCCKIVKKPNR